MHKRRQKININNDTIYRQNKILDSLGYLHLFDLKDTICDDLEYYKDLEKGQITRPLNQSV